jgi:hypothetical protein
MEKLHRTMVNVELTDTNLLRYILDTNLPKLCSNVFAAPRMFSSPPVLVASAETGLGVMKQKNEEFRPT